MPLTLAEMGIPQVIKKIGGTAAPGMIFPPCC